MRIRVQLMKRAALLLISVALVASPSLAFAVHEGADHRAQESAPSAQSAEEDRPGRGRLRFRDGPVCMCSQGMSEADIQRAQQERRGGWWRRNSSTD